VPFTVPADSYDAFIGRYSRELAPRFADFAAVDSGPVLDVGCGPGSLASELAARLGGARVAAVDTSEPFVAACRERVSGADVRVASAEALPFADGTFAAALSQLVLSFIRHPDRMMAEVVRVVRGRGVVAACTFEANGFALARTFWEAARRFDPRAPDDADLPFRRMPELVALWERAGLRDVETGVIEVGARYTDFEDLWSPLELGIGPTGEYLSACDAERRSQIRTACFDLLGRPGSSFSLPARALAIRGFTRATDSI
jgi:SAM-dependent methyltransferase